MDYNIAEIFNSIQGEGMFVGTPMTFIRLAGCNVGVYARELSDFPMLGSAETPKEVAHGEMKSNYSVCTSFDGTRFVCDTDYHAKRRANEVYLEAACLPHVCLTGGEPFLHDLGPLLERLTQRNHEVHIETSGTKPMDIDVDPWITCSPKQGFLKENYKKVNEFKFLVSGVSDLKKIKEFLRAGYELGVAFPEVFLSPINDLYTVDKARGNELVSWLCNNQPTWRLSMQMHKLLGVR